MHILAIFISILLKIHIVVATNVEDYVLEFGDSNIQSTLEKANYSLIYFYKDECKFCSEFNPTFEYISTLYNNRNGPKKSNLQIIKTNGKTNTKLNSLFKIERYPTLKLLNYDTKAIISYKEKNRELETILEFIKKETQIFPNYDSIDSNLIYLDDSNFDNFIKNSENDTIVVFILSYLQDWESYYYPNHFYQLLSKQYNDLNFALVDASQFESSHITSSFHIVDYPTLIYFSKSGGFKIYRNKLQIQLSGNTLDENNIKSFISQVYTDSNNYGVWYNNTESLFDNIKGEVYDNTKHIRNYGFNFRQQTVEGDDESDVLEEYKSLISELEL